MCAQLILVCVVGCYLLNSFQSKLILILHNISHQLASKEYFQDYRYESNHNFLNSKLSNEYHGHSHSDLHEHKSLSFIQTILNYDISEDPFVKHKKDFKVDKHIVTHSLSDNPILLESVKNKYGYTVFIVNSPYLKLKAPPPRFTAA